MQRYQQLTNPNENQDQVLIQNLLSNLVGKEDHELLLKNLNQSEVAQEETVRLLDRQLNEMGFDAEEVKQTQPRFFEMIVLCYQANIAKLQMESGTDQQPTESQANQLMAECLQTTIAQMNEQREEPAAAAQVVPQSQLYESRSHVNISRFILQSQRQQHEMLSMYFGGQDNLEEIMNNLPLSEEQLQYILEQQHRQE